MSVASSQTAETLFALAAAYGGRVILGEIVERGLWSEYQAWKAAR